MAAGRWPGCSRPANQREGFVSHLTYWVFSAWGEPKMIPADLKVLLIEDNPEDVAILKNYLASHCSSLVDIEVCQRLAEAKKRLGQGNADIDVILLDLGLPDSEGLETFSAIHQQAPKIPVVVLSGLEDEELAMRTVREGAQDYLVKGKLNGDLLYALCAMRWSA